MNKTLKIGILSLIAITQVLALVVGFQAYQKMDESLWHYQMAYKELVEQTGGLIIDFIVTPNPFMPVVALLFLGLCLALTLIIDEARHKSTQN